MNKPLVSCLIPTWNRSEYLAETIYSLLGQDYKNIEIIVVDDGSTDSTPILMTWFEKNQPKVKYFQEKHRGIAATRNTAIQKAQGDYIAVCDSDDMYASRRISKQIKLLESNPDLDFTYSGYMECDENMQGRSIVEPPKDFTAEGIRDNKTVPHGSLLARSYCFIQHPYNDRFVSNDDKKLLWDWFKARYKGKPVEDTLYLKRNHEEMVSNTDAKNVDLFNKEIDAEINDYLQNTAK